jgi:hypothetical protein
MSEDNHQEKNEELPRESIEEFCKRLGIRMNKRSGGQEFSPYHGSHHFTKKPKQNSKD